MTNSTDLPNKPTLSAVHQEILRQQVIDEKGPGPILRDFSTLVNFIGPKGIEVSGKYHLLPMRCLADLNARMTLPLQLGLRRPQQKSYPHINGLYLLLRATGLAHIKTDGRKPRLILSQPILSAWAELNPTERYFILLESWLLRGEPEIVGERSALFSFEHPVMGWTELFKEIPNQGLGVGGNREVEEHLRYFPGLRNLALLELFGFVTVQHNPAQPKAGWQIDRIWRTPLGEAMCPFLHQTIRRNLDVFITDDGPALPVGLLQPIIQPYFPAWRHNLVLPEPQFEPGPHIFKVSLAKDLWRQIAVPGDIPLDFFSHTILDAFDFDHDHPDRFTYTDHFGVSRHIYHPYMEKERSSAEVRVGDLPLTSGQSMTYLFDFGDEWLFEVKLERVDPPNSEITRPVILEEYGAAPEQYPSWE